MFVSLPITVWSRKNADGEYEHNHIEDGHATTKLPKPKCDNHVKAWAKGDWKAEHAHIIHTVPKVVTGKDTILYTLFQ